MSKFLGLGQSGTLCGPAGSVGWDKRGERLEDLSEML